MVHGRRTLVDGSVDSLPRSSGRGEDRGCADRGRGVHLSNAKRLERTAEAGPDEVVLVRETKYSSIDTPGVGELTSIGVRVERSSTTSRLSAYNSK